MGIGGLSELHDRQGQVGADFQAWSMAGLIASLHHFAGIDVDALGKEVRIAPSLPPDWPYLRARSRVGDTHFTVEYDVPSPREQHLAVHLSGRTPPGYTLHVGVPLPRGSHIRAARCNGVRMPVEAWSDEDASSSGTNARAWSSMPLQRRSEIVIEICRT